MIRFEVQVTAGSNLPIYRQIVDQIRMAVATGAIAPGDQLSSVRAVAERLIINPNTVARAYADLAREGILETQPGRGIFVAERRQRYSDQERARLLALAVEDFARQVILLDFSREEILAKVDERLAALDPDVKEATHA